MRNLPNQGLAGLPDSDQCLFTPQKYALFRFNYNGDGIRYIGTWGLAPCVGLVLYDATSHSGMVAHFDSDAAALASPHGASRVAEGLFNEFRAGAGRSPSAAHVVQGTTFDISGAAIVAALFTACEDQGVAAELVYATHGDLVVSLRTGALCGIQYNLGVSAKQWVRLAIGMNRSSNGAIKVVRLETPVTAAAGYAAP